VLVGHLLRRIRFGPTPEEVARVGRMGVTRYVDYQLNYAAINDAAAMQRLPPAPRNKYDDWAWMRRWYTRKVYSRRQILERMTLIWHAHFATSNEKVGIAYLSEHHQGPGDAPLARQRVQRRESRSFPILGFRVSVAVT
jgi:hypothetical protein